MEVVRIDTLDPATAPPAHASVRGIITLSWPYSSSTRRCALLIADPDFRLRNRKGQVRIQFTEASAEAVAKSRVGIGDEVLLQLDGARWGQDTEATRTPGKSVEGELVFGRKLNLTVSGVEGDVEINVDMHTLPKCSEMISNAVQETPLPKEVQSLRSNLDGLRAGSPPLYSSPAFAKRLRLSGEYMPGSAYDPFADEFVTGLSKAKVGTSFGETKQWRYAEKTPSPTEGASTWLGDEGEVRSDFIDRSHVENSSFWSGLRSSSGRIGVLTRFETKMTAAESPKHASDQQSVTSDAPVTQFSETGGNSLAANDHSPDTYQPQSAMAPPPLPHLQILAPYGEQTAPGQRDPSAVEADALSTPKLQAVPNSLLPLPSPFPVDEVEPSYSMAGLDVPSQGPAIESDFSSEVTTAERTIGDESRGARILADGGRNTQVYAEYESDTEEDDELYVGVSVRRAEAGKQMKDGNGDIETMDESDTLSHDRERTAAPIGMHTETPSAVESKRTSKIFKAAQPENNGPTQNETQTQQRSLHSLPASQPQTPVKLPAGLFGFDGTTAAPAPAQSTPQSEKDRIMAQTFKSLFGFRASPDAQLPPRQDFLTATPTPKLGWMNMGRVSETDLADQAPTSKADRRLPDQKGSGSYRSGEASLSEHASSPEGLRDKDNVFSAMEDVNSPVDQHSSELSAKVEIPASPPDVVELGSGSDTGEDASPARHVAVSAGLVSPSPVTQAQKRRDVVQDEDEIQELPSSFATIGTGINDEEARVSDPSTMQAGASGDRGALQDDFNSESMASDHQPRREISRSRPPSGQDPPTVLEHGHIDPFSAHEPFEHTASSQDVHPSAHPGNFQMIQSPPEQVTEDSQDLPESCSTQQMPTVDDTTEAISVSFRESPALETQMTLDLHVNDISGEEPAEPSMQHEVVQISSSLPIEKSKTATVEESRDGEVRGAEISEITPGVIGPTGGDTTQQVVTKDMIEQNPREISSLPPQRTESQYLGTMMDTTAEGGGTTGSQAKRHTEIPTGMTTEVSYPPLPPSPRESQSQHEEPLTRVLRSHPQETRTSDMPPTPRLTQRESDTQESLPAALVKKESSSVESEATMQRVADEQAATRDAPSPQQRTFSRKSLSKRLSNVPDVISAWFSPRRSKRNTETAVPRSSALSESQKSASTQSSHPSNDHNAPVSPTSASASAATAAAADAARGLTTSLAYFTPLSQLHHHLHGPDIDVLAVITAAPKAPSRASSGRKDFYTIFQIADPSLPPSGTEEEMRVSGVPVGVFRPWKATLPGGGVGDVVLFRGFGVRWKKKQLRLVSGETSGWCVWRYGAGEDEREKGDGGAWPREEIKGPPVEVGEAEREHVRALRKWWIARRGEVGDGDEEKDAHSDEMV